ncbi:YafY family protein [Anaerocaecibacter muris]|uniref:helix-turn-helix transcriptional regulator n=1 Tax=Anaerocaecibacter muris TaxID=2941513 RepID=UPI0030846EE5
MQQSNVFSILMILMSKRKVSRDYLAERFSISKRTVSRYLNILEDAGVPITSVPGRGGGVMLADDYIIDKSFLSEAETIRIKNALSRTADEFDDKANLAIIEKLNSVNKSREQDGFAVKQDALYIDCDYEQAAFLRPRMKILSGAIEASRAVEINYTDARGFSSYRTIEPYTLVFKSGAWYIYAMCKLRGDFRLFKLSRISDLRLTSKGFIKYESKLTEKLELEYYNEVYADLEFEFYSPVTDSVIDWLGLSAITERGTRLIASAEVPMNDALVKRLLSYGSSVKVLNPPELVETIRAEAERMAKIYNAAK